MDVSQEVNEFRRQREKEDNNFRMGYQRKEQRREWDLQDPKRLVKEPPTRLGDVDPRLGASSIQVFGGEDVNWPTRKKVCDSRCARATAAVDRVTRGNTTCAATPAGHVAFSTLC